MYAWYLCKLACLIVKHPDLALQSREDLHPQTLSTHIIYCDVVCTLLADQHAHMITHTRLKSLSTMQYAIKCFTETLIQMYVGYSAVGPHRKSIACRVTEYVSRSGAESQLKVSPYISMWL